ncbi:DUF397 domain-containing protein [Streptomyces sp. AHU1]|uniref:DUF397 domain-containing protein n=1 Tax=Streptomyces sp. AHU1 TaxID=3377215 RepID=UPI0038780ED9
MASTPTHQWFKSTYSGGSGTECVECALTEDGALLRDSKNIHGAMITVHRPAWHAFIEALRSKTMLETESRDSVSFNPED